MDRVCASDPEGVAAALRKLGYRADLGRHEESGDPMIQSAASGYDFTIHFNDCKASKECKSLGFIIAFANDGTNTPELANKWNKQKRFSQMAAFDDGRMGLSYDLSTVGGVNMANFADVVDWWQVILGQVREFFAKETP